MANTYDQASRYLIRRDSAGLLPWFFVSLPHTVRFLGWLDTRNIPFPGEADRTGDTVACVEDTAEPGPLWAIPVEFQSKPDLEMFGRYQEYMGALWRQKRPAERPGEHYCVVGCLVNLTGNPDSSRDYQLGAARNLLQFEECNIATKDAGLELNAVATGKVSTYVLALIPLMQKGSEPGIIKQWLELARAEPDERKRGDYGGLALVFAELAGCRLVWKQALQGWNMQVSQQVLEWQAEAAARGAASLSRQSPNTVGRSLRSIARIAAPEYGQHRGSQSFAKGVPSGDSAAEVGRFATVTWTPQWKQALQGWNMQVSQQVLEWQAEAAALACLRVRREDLRTLLEDRFGPLPELLLQRIAAIEDPERLRSAMRKVHVIQTPDELQL